MDAQTVVPTGVHSELFFRDGKDIDMLRGNQEAIGVISIKAQDIVSENAGKQWRVMARISQLKYETHRLTDA